MDVAALFESPNKSVKMTRVVLVSHGLSYAAVHCQIFFNFTKVQGKAL